MKFTKMHGCGNDYVYVNCFEQRLNDESAAAKLVSDRHFGIGGDGMILIKPSEIADFEMVMYNADGSRGAMCGNGIRCVAKYVYDYGLTDKTDFSIESMGQIKYISVTVEDGRVTGAQVDMGAPVLAAQSIPVLCGGDTAVMEPIEVNGTLYHMTCVSMGNPHAVVFIDGEVRDFPLEKVGPEFENHSRFPDRVNTEFAKIADRKTIDMRVWERGAGETLACGTGACATAVAAMINGLCEHEVTVRLTGGDLNISWSGNLHDSVMMTGPAVTVFDGEINIPQEDKKYED